MMQREFAGMHDKFEHLVQMPQAPDLAVSDQRRSAYVNEIRATHPRQFLPVAIAGRNIEERHRRLIAAGREAYENREDEILD